MTVHLCVSHKHKTAGHTGAGNTLRKKKLRLALVSASQRNTPLVKKKEANKQQPSHCFPFATTGPYSVPSSGDNNTPLPG